MTSPSEMEEAFVDFSQNLPKHAPDGIIPVDLFLLQTLGLLQYDQFDQSTTQDNIMHQFHVLETPDKVTLFNDRFVVWILPKVVNEMPMTLIFLALIQNSKLHLELVFSTSGVYNTPKYILKVLEHFLTEVIDTEAIISSMNRLRE